MILSAAGVADEIGRVPPADAEAVKTRPSAVSTGVLAGLGAAALVAVGLALWQFAKTPAIVDLPTGTLVLEIAPWANIDAITAKRNGKAASGGCVVTPCVLSLPAGEYHVRASNPNFAGPVEFDVTIEAGGVREVRQKIPGLNVPDEVSKILDK
jgi:hypothetical protein